MNESVFNPAGPQADRIAGMWWYMFSVSSAVWILVVIALLYAAWHGHRRDVADQSDETNDRLRRRVSIAAGITVFILVGTLVYDVFTGEALASLPRDNALRIRITGHQWWWEAEYIDPVPGNHITTANEIHIPVGEPVQIIGSSADVIHSFWIPDLAGKKDLIPGHATAMWLQADKPGIYRGQCAEFCGHQHAKMAVLVMAEPRSQFNTWYKTQQLPAAPPSDSMSRVGEKVFMSRGCPVCHTVGGTLALGRIGPPLTHIGSSYTLAAGTLKNTRGNLAGWIVDPQGIKPGVKMPPNDLSGSELQAILSYLTSLK
ncbi:MAG TPA: cytochrome c oxidase subunit II [Gemmatimonadaceae bacterium]|nr:cytochrome c oxidase subunit II [Gemmatimonadaceae bacterium]